MTKSDILMIQALKAKKELSSLKWYQFKSRRLKRKIRIMHKEKLDFLLEFFKNETHAGWAGIATKLLENGFCIVAGEGCIWNGGIGSFIDTSPALNAVGCTLYEFDLLLIGSKTHKLSDLIHLNKNYPI